MKRRSILIRSKNTNKLTSCKVNLLIYSSGGHEFFLQWNKFPPTMLRNTTQLQMRIEDTVQTKHRGPNIKCRSSRKHNSSCNQILLRSQLKPRNYLQLKSKTRKTTSTSSEPWKTKPKQSLP